MKTTNSIFSAYEPEKIVVKKVECIELAATNVLLEGKLRSVRLQDNKVSREYSLLLTEKFLYYAKNTTNASMVPSILTSKAFIRLEWLRVSFFSLLAGSGRYTYYIQLNNSNRKAVFCTDDLDHYCKWKQHLSKLLINTDFDGKFKVGRRLGKGGSASVYKASEMKTGRVVACKKFNKAEIMINNTIEALVNEVEALRRMKGHPHVVELEEVHETEQFVYIVTEVLEGGMIFKEGRKYKEADVLMVARSLLLTAASLEEAGIVHRDLKPSNIHFKYASSPLKENVIKVLDFGISVIADKKQTLGKISGTLGYMAPEAFTKLNYSTMSSKSDIFSIGVILYNAVSGTRLFYSESKVQRRILNCQAKINFYTTALSNISPRCKITSVTTPQESAQARCFRTPIRRRGPNCTNFRTRAR